MSKKGTRLPTVRRYGGCAPEKVSGVSDNDTPRGLLIIPKIRKQGKRK